MRASSRRHRTFASAPPYAGTAMAKNWPEISLEQAASAAPRAAAQPNGARVGIYLQIARPDHWIKNIFVVPGVAAALAVAPHAPGWRIAPLVLAVIGVCLTASANYTLNEFLDAQYDRFHPLKSERPGAQGLLDSRLVFLQYLLLASVGL